MIGALFLKECRKIAKSLVYYVYLVAFVLFITGQMSDVEWVDQLSEPQPGQESYGYGYSNDERMIMQSGMETLFQELLSNRFATYPFGFYKEVTLNEEEQEVLKRAMQQCTGMEFEQMAEENTAYWMEIWMEAEGSAAEFSEAEMWHVPLREDLTYEEFEQVMEKACEIVGSRSYYEKSFYEKGGIVALTYEDALEHYRELCEDDKVSGAQMRLFCDYACIFLAVLPIFVGVSACLKDKRAKAAELIRSRSVSGAALIGCRYLANVVMCFVPVLLCALLMQMPYVYAAGQAGIEADALAFVKYSFLWLLPVIMVVLGAAFLLTEATETILAIPVLLAWAFGSVLSAATLTGNFGWKLVTRWNTFGSYGRYAEELGQLYRNKGMYMALAVILVLLTVAVYEKKRRKGEMLYGKLRKNNS